MDKVLNYLRSVFYNIWQNKPYALFCLFGTTLTFIFIIILLQLLHTVTGNQSPLRNADRTIKIGVLYGDNGPEHVWDKTYRLNEQDIIQLSTLVENYEAYGISHTESVNPLINGQLKTVVANFVNPDYWRIKDYNFLQGRPFTQADYNEVKPVAVIKESNARKYFGNPASAMGQEIEFQGNVYRIIGVVEDFSLLAADEWSGLWVPHKYNKGIPSGYMSYEVNFMFPAHLTVAEMKENVRRAIKYHFEQQQKEIVEPTEFYTFREEIQEKIGGNIFRYGVIAIILVLLIIPAVNIVTLNIANADKRSEEIAVRKAMGATRLQAFLLIITETFVLILLGTLLGFLFSFPILKLVENNFLDYGIGEGTKLIGKMNYWVMLFGVIPVAAIFALMAGGWPAWKIAKRKIAVSLKGETAGEENHLLKGKKGFLGIYIEQSLVCIVLMLCIVSILKKVELYRTPGMLDTGNTLIFGYAASGQHADFNWKDVREAIKGLEVINEELKKKSYVEAISKNNNFMPYGAAADGMTFTINIDGVNIMMDFMAADPEALTVLKPKLDEGQWFSEDDNYEKVPAVITRQLADSLDWYEAVGRTLVFMGNVEAQVIGVLEGLKKDVFRESQIGIVIPASYFAKIGMTGSSYYSVRLTDLHEKDNFTNEYYNLFKRRINSDSVVEPVVSDLERYKTEQLIKSVGGLIAQSIPTLFFLIFGFIGTFGLFWLYTGKRTVEFALRRALGATKKEVLGMVLKESFILTLCAAIPALILAVFIYNFRIIEITGILITITSMLLFSIFSTFYPAYRASRTSPAESLHYE